MIVYRFDKNGNEAGTKNVDENYQLKDGEFLSLNGLIKPFNQNGTLIETATQSEIDKFYEQKREEYNYNLAIIINSLELGSERTALGIVGEDEYIDSQIKIYNLKYKVAKGEEDDLPIGNLTTLEIEALQKGQTVEELKNSIIEKHNSYETTKKQFLLMIEFARKKTQKYIDNNSFYEADFLFNLMRKVQRNSTIAEIQLIFQDVVTY